MELLLLKGLKVPLFKLSVTSRKSTIFKFEAISIRSPSNLNVLIIFVFLRSWGHYYPG